MDKCPFCSNDVILTQSVYENSAARVFYSLTPATHGTVLVVPKRHVERFEDLDSKDLIAMQAAVKAAVKAFQAIYDVKDYIVLQKNGELAGRTVEHLHLHLIPTKVHFSQIIDKAFDYRPPLSKMEMAERTNELRNFFRDAA